MNSKKRLIITSLFSIFLVSILMLGSTYSIFNSTDIDEEANIYKTGTLDITYTVSSEEIILDTSVPISNDDIGSINPYQITVTNTGNVAYKFNLILDSTTASNEINNKYIMTKVGKMDSVSLDKCSNNIIKEGIVVLAGESVSIDVRIYVSDNIQNTEIGKSFYAKLKVDGLAIYNDSDEVDNSNLVSERYLGTANVGSYVKYSGNNGCEGNLCDGNNANYVDDDNMGYCGKSSNKFNVNGWRIAYIDNSSIYLISAGAIECVATDEKGNIVSDIAREYEEMYEEKHLDNLNNIALKYCNSAYAYKNTCDSNSAWSFNEKDFKKIMNKSLSSESCFSSDNEKADMSCGGENNLINNGGYYWISLINEKTKEVFNWDASVMGIYNSRAYNLYGVRPVLRLKSSLVITDGIGSYEDPYTIEIK